ncbi:MAG TPA: hypothetical protein VMW89_10355 [Desulfatiglandales bacterium]|nr:hypothetical protein [Desulfatiglandales bacterium]
MTAIGDVVLIHLKEEPSFFARIDSIEPDVKRDWFRVELLILAVPLTTVTWILREEYINGAPFTMEGNPVRIDRVKPLDADSHEQDQNTKMARRGSTTKGGKVVPFGKPRKGDRKGP